MVVRSSDFSRITVAAVSRSAKNDARSLCPRELSLQNLSLLSDAQNSFQSLICYVFDWKALILFEMENPS